MGAPQHDGPHPGGKPAVHRVDMAPVVIASSPAGQRTPKRTVSDMESAASTTDSRRGSLASARSRVLQRLETITADQGHAKRLCSENERLRQEVAQLRDQVRSLQEEVRDGEEFIRTVEQRLAGTTDAPTPSAPVAIATDCSAPDGPRALDALISPPSASAPDMAAAPPVTPPQLVRAASYLTSGFSPPIHAVTMADVASSASPSRGRPLAPLFGINASPQALQSATEQLTRELDNLIELDEKDRDDCGALENEQVVLQAEDVHDLEVLYTLARQTNTQQTRAALVSTRGQEAHVRRDAAGFLEMLRTVVTGAGDEGVGVVPVGALMRVPAARTAGASGGAQFMARATRHTGGSDGIEVRLRALADDMVDTNRAYVAGDWYVMTSEGVAHVFERVTAHARALVQLRGLRTNVPVSSHGDGILDELRPATHAHRIAALRAALQVVPGTPGEGGVDLVSPMALHLHAMGAHRAPVCLCQLAASLNTTIGMRLTGKLLGPRATQLVRRDYVVRNAVSKGACGCTSGVQLTDKGIERCVGYAVELAVAPVEDEVRVTLENGVIVDADHEPVCTKLRDRFAGADAWTAHTLAHVDAHLCARFALAGVGERLYIAGTTLDGQGA